LGKLEETCKTEARGAHNSGKYRCELQCVTGAKYFISEGVTTVQKIKVHSCG